MVSATEHLRTYDREERMTGQFAAGKTRVEHSQDKRGGTVAGAAGSRMYSECLVLVGFLS